MKKFTNQNGNVFDAFGPKSMPSASQPPMTSQGGMQVSMGHRPSHAYPRGMAGSGPSHDTLSRDTHQPMGYGAQNSAHHSP